MAGATFKIFYLFNKYFDYTIINVYECTLTKACTYFQADEKLQTLQLRLYSRIVKRLMWPLQKQ